MKQKRKERLHSRILLENPYDIETIFEALSIAKSSGKEIHFMDKLLFSIRNEPNIDITELSYNLLNELKLLDLEKTE